MNPDWEYNPNTCTHRIAYWALELSGLPQPINILQNLSHQVGYTTRLSIDSKTR